MFRDRSVDVLQGGLPFVKPAIWMFLQAFIHAKPCQQLRRIESTYFWRNV
jgi:hypothetical protein